MGRGLCFKGGDSRLLDHSPSLLNDLQRAKDLLQLGSLIHLHTPRNPAIVTTRLFRPFLLFPLSLTFCWSSPSCFSSSSLVFHYISERLLFHPVSYQSLFFLKHCAKDLSFLARLVVLPLEAYEARLELSITLQEEEEKTIQLAALVTP